MINDPPRFLIAIETDAPINTKHMSLDTHTVNIISHTVILSGIYSSFPSSAPHRHMEI